MSFKIKDIEIQKNVILAPMAGITSFSYRKFMRKFCPDCLVYSEMISDCGLIYGNKETGRLLYTDNNESPYAIQIFGGSKETIIKGIKILEEKLINYDFLDLNLACPVNKVIKGYAGSYWLQDLDKLYEMVKEVVKVSSKPVTCKVRLGFNEININEICKTLENAGVSFIAIHARTRKELYSGIPHYDALKDIHKIINIPFGISGNIFKVEDALKAKEITKADAILVARGAIGNPKLLLNIQKALNNEEYDETINFNEQKDFLLEFSNLLINEKGERQAISILKGLAPKFFTNLPFSKEIRISLSQEMNSKEDLLNILNKYSK